MRSSKLIRTLGIVGIVGMVASCDAGPDGGAAGAGQTDSTALAVAVAEALGAEIGGGLGESEVQGAFILEPGATAFDTLLAREIERTQAGRPAGDTTRPVVLSTHGFERRGDSVAVTIVVRSCSPGDSSFSYTKDSLVHFFVPSEDASRGWRLAGPVMRDYSIGDCTPTESVRNGAR